MKKLFLGIFIGQAALIILSSFSHLPKIRFDRDSGFLLFIRNRNSSVKIKPMKYILKNTTLEGSPIEKEGALYQAVRISGAITTNEGAELVPTSDTIEVKFTSDSIEQSKTEIDSAVTEFISNKYVD